MTCARRPKTNAARRAFIGILEIDQDLGMMIFAACPKFGSAAGMKPGSHAAAEQRFKKITVRASIGAFCSAATKFESGAPVRRWVKFFSRLPIGTQLIIGRAFFRVFEYRIGLAKFLELVFGARLFADVRMIFAGKLSVRTLDFVLGCRAFDAHDFVIVFIIHGRLYK
jgi:hypothetical protein